MARLTTRFGFLAIEPGDDPYQLGHKFFASDKDLLDLLLWLAMSGHVHTGGAAVDTTPATAPTLELATTGGSLGAGRRIWYTYTFVNSTTGLETAAAPSSFIDTPAPVAVPDAPTLAYGATGGTLIPGQHFYLLTSYTDASTNETPAGPEIGVIIPPGTLTNRIVLTFPGLPVGATGFNIYRRKPGGRSYLFVESIAIDVATPPDEWIDDGALEDCDRIAPTVNTTNATNAITVTLPDELVPAGSHWKVYRTVNQDNFSASLVQIVVEETEEDSGIIVPFFVDQGFQTLTGAPPSGTFNFASPEQIVLTDAAEIQGFLPPGRVSAFPVVVSLVFPGGLTEGPGESVWPCPFEDAVVVHAFPSLGVGSIPVADPVIADVLIGRGPTPVFTSVYAAPQDMPMVPVGHSSAFLPAPATAEAASRRLGYGDCLTSDLIQIGGSATPTDEDLTVNVLLYVRVGDPDVSVDWS